MGARNGNYSRFMFDESKRYMAVLLQETRLGKPIPLVDADWNDQGEILLKLLMRMIQRATGDGTRGDEFKIAEATSPSNNFKVTAGIAANLEDAARYWVGGLPCLLVTDQDYTDTGSVDLHRPSSGLSDTVLTDSAANWRVNEHATKKLVPNIADGTQFTIISNTINTITVSGGGMTAVAAVGDRYRVELSTPVPPSGPVRNDYVYLDVYLDEADSVEDTDLLHSVQQNFYTPSSPTSVEAARRLKLEQAIIVREDVTGPSDELPETYLDTDGNRHYSTLIAILHRDPAETSPDEIIDSQIEDKREVYFGSSQEVKDARGDFDSLDERLDDIADDSGQLQKNHDELLDMPDAAVDPTLAVSDHDPRYGDLEYSAGPAEAYLPGESIVKDNETHRDAISRINAEATNALKLRSYILLNA